MPRKGRRTTIARGIYKDSGGYEIRVMVQGVLYVERWPLGTDLAALRKARAALTAKAKTETPTIARGTLRADTPKYLTLIRHLASYRNRKAHLDHWIALYGRKHRRQITPRDVLEARNRWTDAGVAPKTINHRVHTLAHLYRMLDGKRLATPCDDLVPLAIPKTIIQRVTDDLILAVDRNLQLHERDPRHPLRDAKTRARFRVRVSTGKRPCEIMRAQPGDVDLEARVWVPRDAKGGFTPGVYLNNEMLAAWQLFIEADAWGAFNTGSFADTIRAAGWPEGVRPYQARHTMWITASERGVDLADIAAGAGHKDQRLTRRTYVPVLNSRLQKMSETMDGRFQGWPRVPACTPDPKPQRKKE